MYPSIPRHDYIGAAYQRDPGDDRIKTDVDGSALRLLLSRHFNSCTGVHCEYVFSSYTAFTAVKNRPPPPTAMGYHWTFAGETVQVVVVPSNHHDRGCCAVLM